MKNNNEMDKNELNFNEINTNNLNIKKDLINNNERNDYDKKRRKNNLCSFRYLYDMCYIYFIFINIRIYHRNLDFFCKSKQTTNFIVYNFCNINFYSLIIFILLCYSFGGFFVNKLKEALFVYFSVNI